MKCKYLTKYLACEYKSPKGYMIHSGCDWDFEEPSDNCPRKRDFDERNKKGLEKRIYGIKRMFGGRN